MRPLILLLVMLSSMPALALRCGTDLIQKGDLKIQVRDKCGEPLSVEVVGYTLRSSHGVNGIVHERENVIEEWIYKLQSKYYDVLTFEAGRLVRLEKIRR